MSDYSPGQLQCYRVASAMDGADTRRKATYSGEEQAIIIIEDEARFSNSASTLIEFSPGILYSTIG